MSKNLTRKGLAFGALVALGTTLIAGAPASAAGVIDDTKVSLAPSAGSTYNTHQFGKFDLTSNFSQSFEEAGVYEKFLIEGDSLSNISYDLDINGSTTDVVGLVVTDGDWLTANDRVTLTFNRTHGLIVDDTFTLDSSTNGIDGDFKVVTRTSDTVVVAEEVAAANNSTADTADTTGTVTAITNANGIQSRAAILARTVGGAGVVNDATATDTRSTNGKLIVKGSASNNSDSTLRLVSNASSTISVNVTAWHDTDGDNVIDGTETQSTTRAVKFVKGAAVSAALTTPTIDQQNFTATVSATDDINVAQLVGDVTVTFYAGDNVITTAAEPTGQTAGYSAANPTAVAYSSTTGALTAKFEPDTTSGGALNAYDIVARTTYGVRAQLWDGTNFTDSAARSNSATGSTVADVIQVSAVAVAGSVKSTKTTLESNTTPNAADYEDSTAAGVATVKAEYKTVSVKVFVGENTIAAGGKSGVPVSLIAKAVGAGDSVGINATDGVKINGSSYVGAAKTFVASTNDSGIATFEITTLTGDAADNIEFSYNVQEITGSGATGDFSVLWAAAAYTAYDANDVSGANVRSIKVGGALALNYVVVDQWGAAPVDGVGRVIAKFSANAGRITAADATAAGAVVGGKAALTLTDNGTGTGESTVVADYVLNADAYANADVTTTVKVVADATPATVTLDALTTSSYGASQYLDQDTDGDLTDSGDIDNRTKLVLSSKTFAAYDGRYAVTTAPESSTGLAVTLTGTVKNAAAAAVAGTPVTLAAKGFQFKSGSVWAVDSITVLTSSTGTFSVLVWSQVGGAQSIKITAGTATAAQALTFAAGTATADTFTLSTSVATVVPGRTVDVTVNVKDKFGNAAQGVTVALKSTGAGYLQSTSGTTDVAGNVVTKLISGVQDSGTATITATVTIAGVATDKVATVNIAVVEPSAVVNVVGHRVYVKFNDAKGEEVSAVIGGVRITKTATYSGYVISKLVKAGKVSVKAYVAGDLVKAATVTVK
jgi:hypothetical protein